ncbi:hypothetical protein QUV58_04915, partial [Succinatimonas hippei]|uniref:hypothetical protein n=1 Tax=Succinatimonas hippei TaxID=626938 RepID=UPI0025A34427
DIPSLRKDTAMTAFVIRRVLRREQEIFKFIKCGYEANADVNAAQNILRRAGLARMARQANLIRGRQQEPTEAYNCSSIVV